MRFGVSEQRVCSGSGASAYVMGRAAMGLVGGRIGRGRGGALRTRLRTGTGHGCLCVNRFK